MRKLVRINKPNLASRTVKVAKTTKTALQRR